MSNSARSGKRILEDGDLSGDVVSSFVNARTLENINFQVVYTDVASPVGTWTLQGSEIPDNDRDDSAASTDWITQKIPSDALHGASIGAEATLQSDGTIDIDGTAAGQFQVTLDGSWPSRLRWKFVNGSGGSGDTGNVYFGGNR